jgi:2-oxoglutarate dehydrogenase E2 component (dihydrolipoamide succinyltransferase)
LWDFQAAVSALHQFPAVNAVIDGDDIIYRDYVDISVAVGTAKVRSIVFAITNLVCTIG